MNKIVLIDSDGKRRELSEDAVITLKHDYYQPYDPFKWAKRLQHISRCVICEQIKAKENNND